MLKPIALALPMLAVLPLGSQTSAEREALEKRIQSYLAQQRAVQDSEYPLGANRPVKAGDAHLIFRDDYQSARAAAAALGRPLLVNFTGYTAINARRMEEQIFREPVVAGQLAGFVEARLHTDAGDQERRDDAVARSRELKAAGGLPTYVILDARSGQEIGRMQGSLLNPNAFTNFLSTSMKTFGDPQPEAASAALWRRIFDLEDQVKGLKSEVSRLRSPASGR
ncbi:MAG: hypothetical protein AAGG01_21155 [Planctomycetota bacterium]